MNNIILLRYFASIQVLIYHFFYLTSSDFYFDYKILNFLPGVPLFFIISGYLNFFSIHKYSTCQYIVKRIFRIYPVIFLYLVLLLIHSYLRGYFNVFEYLIYFLSNLTFLQFIDYNPLSLVTHIHSNGSLWSISVELSMYVFTILFLKNLKFKYSISIFIFFTFLNFLYFIYPEKDLFFKIFGVTFLPWFYMYLSGFFLAKYPELKNNILKVNSYLFIGFFVSFLLLLYYFEMKIGNYLNLFHFFLLAVLFVKIGFSPRLFFISKLSVFRYDLTYSLYVFHIPIINFFIFENLNLTILNYILSCFFLSMLVFLFIERPILRRF